MNKFELETNAKFAAHLKELIPEKGKLSNQLIDVLDIDKAAAYRRLRNEIPFTFAEIIKLSSVLNISLDEFLGAASPYRNYNYRMFWQNVFDLEEKDFKMSEDFVSAIRAATCCPQSEFGIASSNTLPLHMLTLFPNVYRFVILKWMYQFGTPSSVQPYSKIVLPERLLDLHSEYHKVVQNIKYTYFITDDRASEHMVRDIIFFNDIRLITNSERAELKDDLNRIIDRFDQIALEGKFSNGNTVELYSTGLSFETTYSYVYSDKMFISMVDVFTSSAMSSVERNSCEHMRTWIRSMKRTSLPITNSEKNRINFVEKQRSITSAL